MFAMSRLRLPIVVIVGFVLAVLLALAAFSSTAEANHSWSNYHWARTDKANLKVVDNLSTPKSGANWRQHLNNTADNSSDTKNDWENPATIQNGYTFTDKLDLTIVGKNDSGYPTGVSSPADCKPIAGHVEACNAEYGSNGWLGLAQIWISSGHITAGTTKLNDSYFNTAKYNTDPWRNLVMCQEVGHDFGLAHTDETFSNTNLGSCMDYTNDPDGGGSYGADNQYPGGVANKRELRSTTALPYHDYNQLAAIYNHSDSSTTTGANSASKLPAEASERAFNRLSELGERIHRSADGRVEIYRRVLGNGDELISRVIRVVEHGTPVPEETTDGTEPTGGNHDHHDHDH